MSTDPIDAYLAELDDPKRSTLMAVRDAIAELLPDAERGLAYGVPVFKVDGKAIAGFAAFEKHLSYLPHSGTVLEALRDDLAGYEWSKGALKFAVDVPLPRPLIAKLITTRLEELN